MPFSSSSDSSGSEIDYEPEESNGRSPILFKNLRALQFTDAYFEDIEGALFNNGHTGE